VELAGRLNLIAQTTAEAVGKGLFMFDSRLLDEIEVALTMHASQVQDAVALMGRHIEDLETGKGRAFKGEANEAAYRQYQAEGGEMSPEEWWKEGGRAQARRRQHGGIDAHIATDTMIMYGERGTGGEAYIPLGPQHRDRSTLLLAEVARQFGHGLVRMQVGGILSGPVSNVGPSSVTYSRRGGDIHIGEVRAHDYHDFKRQMERERRLRSLIGDP
jgi:hypothetical protein